MGGSRDAHKAGTHRPVNTHTDRRWKGLPLIYLGSRIPSTCSYTLSRYRARTRWCSPVPVIFHFRPVSTPIEFAWFCLPGIHLQVSWDLALSYQLDWSRWPRCSLLQVLVANWFEGTVNRSTIERRWQLEPLFFCSWCWWQRQPWAYRLREWNEIKVDIIIR